MKNLTANQQIIANDILRYKKNKLAGGLALLGLVFNCLYFLLLYAMPRDEFRTYAIGISVVLTLVMLLTIFLSSEGVKGYNKKFSIVLLVCAAFQILRIFYYPLKGIRGNLFIAAGNRYIGYFGIYPSFTEPSSTGFFILMLVYLLLSATCLIASAVWGFIVATRLEKFQKRVDNGEISINDTIREMDSEDAATAQVQTGAVEPSVTAEDVTDNDAVQEQPVVDGDSSSEVE